MVVVGTDTHKRNHTVVAVDAAGAEIASVTVAATPRRASAVSQMGGAIRAAAVGGLRTAGRCLVASRVIYSGLGSERYGCHPS